MNTQRRHRLLRGGWFNLHNYGAWLLGIITMMAIASINTYVNAQQVPAQAAQLAQTNNHLADIDVKLGQIVTRLDDAQTDRDHLRGEIAEVRGELRSGAR